jgi:hypothetical protein
VPQYLCCSEPDDGYYRFSPRHLTHLRRAAQGAPALTLTYDPACQRHRRRCSSYEKADALAEKLRKEIKTGGWDVLALRGSEKHAYERCREWLRRCGKPLDFVDHEYVEAAEILKGLSVVEAARFYANVLQAIGTLFSFAQSHG